VFAENIDILKILGKKDILFEGCIFIFKIKWLYQLSGKRRSVGTTIATSLHDMTP